MVKCPSCGEETDSSKKFCVHCGNKLVGFKSENKDESKEDIKISKDKNINEKNEEKIEKKRSESKKQQSSNKKSSEKSQKNIFEGIESKLDDLKYGTESLINSAGDKINDDITSIIDDLKYDTESLLNTEKEDFENIKGEFESLFSEIKDTVDDKKLSKFKDLLKKY